MEFAKYNVRFATTNDDKDNNDVVSAEVFKNGQRITNQNGWGGGDTWRDHTFQGPFEIELNERADGARVESDGTRERIQFKLMKTSTDGWQFRMTVHGILDDGYEVLLLETANTRFEDQTQDQTWDILK